MFGWIILEDVLEVKEKTAKSFRSRTFVSFTHTRPILNTTNANTRKGYFVLSFTFEVENRKNPAKFTHNPILDEWGNRKLFINK